MRQPSKFWWGNKHLQLLCHQLVHLSASDLPPAPLHPPVPPSHICRAFLILLRLILIFVKRWAPHPLPIASSPPFSCSYYCSSSFPSGSFFFQQTILQLPFIIQVLQLFLLGLLHFPLSELENSSPSYLISLWPLALAPPEVHLWNLTIPLPAALSSCSSSNFHTVAHLLYPNQLFCSLSYLHIVAHLLYLNQLFFSPWMWL